MLDGGDAGPRRTRRAGGPPRARGRRRTRAAAERRRPGPGCSWPRGYPVDGGRYGGPVTYPHPRLGRYSARPPRPAAAGGRQDVRRDRAPSTGSTSTSPPARASGCSAPTARASRRPCACSPARPSRRRRRSRCSGTRSRGESKQARARMGVVPQRENLDEELTCAAEPHGVGDPAARAAARRATPRWPPRSRPRSSSTGPTPRSPRSPAGCAAGCSSRGRSCTSPALVLLDEPTVGLDPQVRGDIWTLIDRLRSQGVTVLMSTHYIEEAERLCDDVAVVSHGKVIARGTPADARRRARRGRGAGVLRAAARGSSASRRSCRRTASARGAPALPCRCCAPRRCRPTCSTSSATAYADAANLEDVFVLLTGERLED